MKSKFNISYFSSVIIFSILTCSIAIYFGFSIDNNLESNFIINNALSISGSTSTFFSNSNFLLPFGFAFIAGLIASLNPCGFMMLPAYIGIFVSDKNLQKNQNKLFHLQSAIIISVSMGLGFLLVFGSIGIIISLSRDIISQYVDLFHWIGFILGFLLILIAIYLSSGEKLYFQKPQSLSSKIKINNEVNFKNYFFFGISYALVSISCTMPIFLALIGSSIARDGVLYGFYQFLLYSAGMTLMIIIITVTISLFKSTFLDKFKKSSKYLDIVSSYILIIVGGYLIFYWLTEGNISEKIINIFTF
ncbi:MAG: hypothetical protein CL748_01645 [Chloroflexi bacterium]|nr:hypothetical protein [Chloroflexota bacterium]|tara:strand:- start:723 stop:1634 length:912 start_codon:yes stop_codon:yes gene_type:complete